MRGSRLFVAAAGALVGLLMLTGCSDAGADRTSKPAVATPTSTPVASGADVKAPKGAPLRSGERFLDLAVSKPYTPKAPTYGTDDYRCFILDPGLAKPAFMTGLDIAPGRPEVVHHVILFRVGPDAVAAAEAKDASETGEGWTCFGGAGLDSAPGAGLDDAPWLGAWAPGGGEQVLVSDIGIPLEAGSRIVMQVHYNLLGGKGSDTSTARLRIAPGTTKLSGLDTMLMPAPVELACRPGRSGPLCDRESAVLDVIGRFGTRSGQTVAGLQLLCDGNLAHPKASPVQHCDRRIDKTAMVRAVAGHMHLLGRSIKVELNPGKPGARTLLDIPVWDFDNQGAQELTKPARLVPGDVLRVTCRHDQRLRDLLPALQKQPERYVVWGEGTTDEMCLGIVLVTK